MLLTSGVRIGCWQAVRTNYSVTLACLASHGCLETDDVVWVEKVEKAGRQPNFKAPAGGEEDQPSKRSKRRGSRPRWCGLLANEY
jgi:hypothetical protein